MARIDYYAIGNAIKTALQADATLSGVTVELETETLMSDAARGPGHVSIYLAGRSATPGQAVAKGTRQIYEIAYSIVCRAASLDPIDALQKRDDLVGKVEIALMSLPDRSFTNRVESWYLGGGEFDRMDVDDGLMAAGEVVLVATARAIV